MVTYRGFNLIILQFMMHEIIRHEIHESSKQRQNFGKYPAQLRFMKSFEKDCETNIHFMISSVKV